MKLKKFLIMAFITTGIFACAYFYIWGLLIIKEKNKEITILKEENSIKEKQIECMATTLMISYNLSKWEAHYYSIIFYDFSNQYKIPWEIFPSIIKIETNFNPTLVSPKGAKGIMQILESTGKITAEKIGIQYIEGQTLWNDLLNLALGCSYLSENIKDMGIEKGVKSYLGGPAYEKSIQNNPETSRSIKDYKASVWIEYQKIVYLYRGIVAESGLNYNKVHIGNCLKTYVETKLF